MVDDSPVVLVTGGTGAGKSTYARALAKERGGLHFAIDDWVRQLYGADKPADAGFDWYMERIARIEEQMRAVAAQALSAGVPVIFDLGFTERAHRERFIAWARERGAAACICLVDVEPGERWRRVEQRNRERGATFALEVTREMFDFMEARFEPPSVDEAPVHRVT